MTPHKHLAHHGAIPNPKYAHTHRRRNRYHPPPPPPTPIPPEGFFLPFDETWRPRYNDTSRVRCGAFATAEMIAIHTGQYVDPEPLYQRALELGLPTPGPGTSPWANLTAAKEHGYIRDFKWFKDIPTATATLQSGLAFIVLAEGHIWCARGFSDQSRALYSPDDTGAAIDWAIPFTTFQQFMEPEYAICGVGLFS